MKTKTTIRIFQETHEVLRVRFLPPAQPTTATTTRHAFPLCEECAAETPLLAPEAAARVSGLSVRAICRLVEAGLIHFKETPDGLLLVCPADLSGSLFDV